jgi:hypothetical protein
VLACAVGSGNQIRNLDRQSFSACVSPRPANLQLEMVVFFVKNISIAPKKKGFLAFAFSLR